ncbi:unnamed protein product [Musa banksii]
MQMLHMPPLPPLMPTQMHSDAEEVREGREWCDVDIDASPLSSFFSDIDTNVSSLFLLIIDVRIDIGKVDHRIVLANHHHNSHPRCYHLSPPLKLSFCLSFSCHSYTCCIFY